MASLKERLAARLAALRERHPGLDHAVTALTYYSERNGNVHAGGVTYFGFLSFFPLLALAFFAVGYISAVAPQARQELLDSIDAMLPGLIGTRPGMIPLATFEEYAGTVGLIGAVALLYTGLGWVSALRRALGDMFQVPRHDRLGFVPGKIRDLGALLVLGAVLVLSVSLSGAMTWFSKAILDWVRLDGSAIATVLLWLVTHGLGVAVSTLWFMILFRFVPHPVVAGRALWQGALVGALGFEVLKSVAGTLITMTMGNPAFQAFGVALVVMLWINYFSRLIMLGASWAYTAPAAEEMRELEDEPWFSDDEAEAFAPAPAVAVPEQVDATPGPDRSRMGLVGTLAATAAAAVAALTWLGRRRLH
jgi:membrane protein